MADPGLKLTISVSDSGEDNRIRFFFRSKIRFRPKHPDLARFRFVTL